MASSLCAALPQIVVTQTIRSCGREPVAFRRGCAQTASARMAQWHPCLALATALIPSIEYLSPDISCAEYVIPQQRQILRDGDRRSFKLAFAGIGCNEVALLQRK
jgi:hypothetical protein